LDGFVTTSVVGLEFWTWTRVHILVDLDLDLKHEDVYLALCLVDMDFEDLTTSLVITTFVTITAYFLSTTTHLIRNMNNHGRT